MFYVDSNFAAAGARDPGRFILGSDMAKAKKGKGKMPPYGKGKGC